MLDNHDKQEIYKMIKQMKEEIRHELAGNVNDGFADRQNIKESVIGTETALCEIDEAMDSRMADIENALCELDEEK